MFVPSHEFFGLLILQVHQPALLEKCAHDDIAHVLEDGMESDLPVKKRDKIIRKPGRHKIKTRSTYLCSGVSTSVILLR